MRDIPVIVGVGHATRHPTDLATTTEPADLLAAAVHEAGEDAGVGPAALAAVDSLDVLNLLSWKYADPAGVVAERIGAHPARAVLSELGGEQPTALVDAAAARIQAGESSLAVVVGGEALASRRAWMMSGDEPPWSARGEPPIPVDVLYGSRQGLAEHGLFDPPSIYPLLENAHRVTSGLPLVEAQAASGRIWAAMSEVAARTPGAWTTEVRRPEDITTPSAFNRPIAHPYLKLMCAQPTVDQAAAVIVTSVAEARRLGIAEDRWIYPWAGAGAADSVDVMARPDLAGSAPLRRSLLDAMEMVDLDADRACFELYSCFPIVPKLALDALSRPDTATCTVAGGLTFYGGPLNAYMACATVHMVHALRRGDAPTGVLYGNGGYATKHHTLIVGVAPPAGGVHQPDDRAARQAELDRRPAPRVEPQPEGVATVETFTVVHDRAGAPERGVVIGRLGDQSRFVARVAPDPDVLAWMISGVDEPIGHRGTVTAAGAEGAGAAFRFDD